MADPAPTTPAPAPTPEELSQETLDFARSVFNAARKGDPTLLQAVDAGLPANLTNEQGNTLLMLAAYSGHPALVTGLLARGADPDRANDTGQTPLAGAVFKGEDAVVRALLAAGANPRAGTPSAIDTARIFKKAELLALLGATDADLRDPLPAMPGPPGRA
ncbi:hypothetical protein POSPLADRAFT_1180793 [Postia placenta MAD-698-R-SB12]|uniref:Uncharacterized protein n=1 Tax=Postia placenta MAD-698-R-SB12 TaxID=670580 RepID=A0A1X6N258_9APHY|nr:hypothetical protein POSPLADRAFT_1180793 [Postia placenta MAD-698-R-SB12]OSX62705.1 hypothetical protein POSPLADRAFT_1180793 [Postia placenta MAD-698-R-SB12]